MILLKDILFEKIITEMPHGAYETGQISYVDFRIEKLDLPTAEKKEITKAFYFGNGIYGKVKNSNKWLKFTPNSVESKSPKSGDTTLPDNWWKYAIIKK
jgi:hypothetical protein